jgi:hypothetical protein
VPSLARISASGSTYAVRRATCADVGAIVELIAADQIGATRAHIEAVRVREDLRGQGLGFTASHEGFKLRL